MDVLMDRWMYVCMDVWMSICIHLHMYICNYAWMDVSTVNKGPTHTHIMVNNGE